MSLTIPTPTRTRAPSRELLRLIETLGDDGWRAAPGEIETGEGDTFMLVARSGPKLRERLLVIHAFPRPGEVRIKDVWRLVAQLNDVQGHEAMLCLGHGATVSRLARETAERLGILISGLEA